MKEQYISENVKKIDPNFPILTNINSINMIYTYFNDGPHNNSFETANYIFNLIKKIEFDVAIISCGSYSLILSNLIRKELNKDIITLGNELSFIFGIVGKRSKNIYNYDYNNENNKYYITNIPESYKPDCYEKIEGGCYW
jgi:hypothetical protein